MPAYLIAIRERTRIRDEYLEYKRLAPMAIGGTSLIRLTSTDRFEVLEGAAAEAVSIIEFPSYQDARAWYESESYQRALRHRLAGADFRVIIVDGGEKKAT
jgi:uncharacterized protein (DUF1330 family)